MRYGKCSGYHRGLRSGHVSTGVVWELGRANCLLAQVTVRDSVSKIPRRVRRDPRAPHASLKKRNTKVDGDARYQGRIVKSEQA